MAGLVTTLHCASCLEDVSQFYPNARLPTCGHLFCPGCAQRCSRERFLCPIDQVLVGHHSAHEPAFLLHLQAWQNAREAEVHDQSLSQALRQYLNFTLFPCPRGVQHQDFAACPYDHSRLEVCDYSRRSYYCMHCKVFSAPDACPRCGHPCVLRARRMIGRSDFQPTFSSPFPRSARPGRGSESTILSLSSPGWH